MKKQTKIQLKAVLQGGGFLSLVFLCGLIFTVAATLMFIAGSLYASGSIPHFTLPEKQWVLAGGIGSFALCVSLFYMINRLEPQLDADDEHRRILLETLEEKEAMLGQVSIVHTTTSDAGDLSLYPDPKNGPTSHVSPQKRKKKTRKKRKRKRKNHKSK